MNSNGFKWVVLLCLLFWLPAGYAQDTSYIKTNNKNKQILKMTREELYLKIFKTAPPKIPNNILGSLLVDNKKKGEIKLIFTEGQSDILFPGLMVLDILSDIIKSDIIKELEGTLDSGGRLSKNSLEKLGIPTTFNASKFQLSINVPSHLRGTQICHLTGRKTNHRITNALAPNPLSAYLNYSLQQELKYSQLTKDKFFRQPLAANIEGAINYKGFVLEGSVFYQQTSSSPFWRNDFRFIFDQANKALRFTAGDLCFPVVGAQSVINMGGIGVSKNYSLLQPSINAFPIRDFEFFLKNPSQVEIWVNGSLTKTIRLNPGTHDIRGFPFSTGDNDVEIKITDAAGQEQFLPFSFTHNRMLLAPGKCQYSFNLGFQRRIKNKRYIYDIKDPVLSLFYQRGINDFFTLGGYSQVRSTQALFGIESLYALPVGQFKFTTSLSSIKGFGTDFTSKCVFTHLPKKSGKRFGIRVRATAEYIGLHFGKIYTTNPLNKELLIISSTVSITIDPSFSLGVGGDYRIVREKYMENNYRLSTTVRKTFFNRLNTYFTIQKSRNYRGNVSTEIIAGLSWSISLKKQSISMNKTTSGDLTLNWHNNSYSLIPGKIRSSATATVGSEKSTFRTKLGYQGNQGNIELTHVTAVAPNQNQNDQVKFEHQTRIALRSAFVYVDKTVALSRPVSNGFVLVKGIKNLKNKKIVINPSSNGYQAISKNYRPAVLNYLPSYQEKKINIKPLRPPIGYVPNKTHFTLFPTYKCGYAFYLGSETNIIVTSSLFDKNGTPVSNQVIKVISLDKTKSEPILAFTNSKGKFQLINITSGNYKIKSGTPNEPWQISFKIPEEVKGIYRLQKLILQ